MLFYLPDWLLDHLETFSTYEDVAYYSMTSMFLVLCAFLIIQGILSPCIYLYYVFTHNLECMLVLYAKPSKKKVLIITAHPHDECMFFGPTILALQSLCDVYLLCLTNDKYLVSNMEKKALWASWEKLGMPASNIIFMKYCVKKKPNLPDISWNGERICGILLYFIETMSFNEVYSYDIRGVNGNLDHINIFYGLCRMWFENKVPNYCKVYLLKTVSKMRKNTWFLDTTLSCVLPKKKLFMVSPFQSRKIRIASQEHFHERECYQSLMHLNRYTYMNTFKELGLDDINLVTKESGSNPFF